MWLKKEEEWKQAKVHKPLHTSDGLSVQTVASNSKEWNKQHCRFK